VIALSVCTECGKGHQLSRGELARPSPPTWAQPTVRRPAPPRPSLRRSAVPS
jgi:hypothetical protein